MEELDRQLATLLDKGYHEVAGCSAKELTALVEPLRALVPRAQTSAESYLPFVLVVRSTLVPTVAAVERIDVDGLAGWTDVADELDAYLAIDGVEVPEDDVYLTVDVSTGPETLGVPPSEALPMLHAAGRTPLTIDEGVALVTQHPEVLTERYAFQALGSRSSNKRIPSLWVSKGAPRLGWCWEGNPHSWLGAASAGTRLASR